VLQSLVCLAFIRKTAVKYAAAEHFPERRDRGLKLAPYLPFLQAQWAAGERNIAALYQAIHAASGIRVQKLLCGSRITSLRKEVGPARRPRRYYPPASPERGKKPRRAVSSRQAAWLALRRPQDLSSEEQRALEFVMQAHAQLEVACKLAQSFALMVREKKVSALEPWRPRSEQEWDSRVTYFCYRDQARSGGSAGCSHLLLEPRSRRGAGPSSQAAQTPIVWTRRI